MKFGGTLGKGAMGTVYDGWDPVIDRRVAIKTAHMPEANDSDAQEALARFKREAQAAGRLSHPNIVGVFDYGETNDVAFIVMEFVSGRSLKEILDTGDRMPLAATVRLMDDVLAGLTYSHDRGVVHRDIKPANVMITSDDRAKIADFGIARIESSNMTQAGTVLGTPAYMSPEQFMGQTVDRRTDIYSTGVLLYQLLTGERPFEGGLTAIMHKVLNTTPPRPSELSVTAPTGLDAVVARAMARRPEDRFDDAASFARAIHAGVVAPDAVHEAQSDATIVETRRPLPVRDATPPAPTVPAARRSNLPIIAGGVGALVAAGLAAFFLLPPTSTVTPPVVLNTSAGNGTVADRPTARQTGPLEPPPTEVKPAGDGTGRELPKNAEEKLKEIVTAPQAEKPEKFAAIVAPSGNSSTQRGVANQPAARPDASAEPPPVAPAVVQPQPAQTPAVQPASVGKPPAPELKLDEPIQKAVATLRPNGEAGRLALGLLDHAKPVLADNDLMLFGLTTPGFAGHLRVDYIQHDGTVTHMVPSVAYPDRTYPAGTRVELGRPRGAFEGWRVGPPFGVDMVVAIVSTAPILPASRADGEPLGKYLADLQAASDSLRRLGGSLEMDTTPHRASAVTATSGGR